MVLEKLKGNRAASEAGSTLIEVLVATLIMVTGVLTMAQMFAIATTSNVTARNHSLATTLAEQKLEQLRSLTWGFDSGGLPVSDFETDTSVNPAAPTGGTGLQASGIAPLRSNTPGYVDHLDKDGEIIGRDINPPGAAVYTRRWSIEALPTNPNNTLIIQVLVTPSRNRGQAEQGNVGRLKDEARVITVKTRKAQ